MEIATWPTTWQGYNEGDKQGTFPRVLNQYGGAKSLREAPKSPNNVTRTFFNTVYWLPKDLRFEYVGAKLASRPGRYLTSLRSCHLVHNMQLLKAFWDRQGTPIAMKTKCRSRLNVEDDLICALPCIGPAICFLTTNTLSHRVDCCARCVIKRFFYLFVFLLCASATVFVLEKLYSRWATDPVFVYSLGHMLEKVENGNLTPLLLHIFIKRCYACFNQNYVL